MTDKEPEKAKEENGEAVWIGLCRDGVTLANEVLRLESASGTASVFHLQNNMAKPLMVSRADVDEICRSVMSWPVGSIEGLRAKAGLLRAVLASQSPVPMTGPLARSLVDDVLELPLEAAGIRPAQENTSALEDGTVH